MSELSVQDGKPVYKFHFSQGGVDYRYTSAAYIISDINGTYTPESVTASNITQTNQLAKNGIQITLPRDNALAQLFLGKVPETNTSLTIYRGHVDADAGDLYWRGRVTSAMAAGDDVTLECEDIFTSMQRPGLRARYQKGCRYALYSPKCGIDIASFAFAGTVLSASGFTLTLDTIGSSPEDGEGYFAGGIVELADGSMRYVMSQDGLVLTLLSPFEDLIIGGGLAVTLYPGCNHTTADCRDKFSNLLNYGGYPYLPGKNPFQNSVTGSIA